MKRSVKKNEKKNSTKSGPCLEISCATIFQPRIPAHLIWCILHTACTLFPGTDLKYNPPPIFFMKVNNQQILMRNHIMIIWCYLNIDIRRYDLMPIINTILMEMQRYLSSACSCLLNNICLNILRTWAMNLIRVQHSNVGIQFPSNLTLVLPPSKWHPVLDLKFIVSLRYDMLAS